MRDYDSTTGRYIQADPLGLVDGASVYGFAGQNPGRYVDPRGEEAASVGGSFGAWGVVEGGKRIGAACVAAAGVQVGVLAGLIVMAAATPVGDGTLQSCDQCTLASSDTPTPPFAYPEDWDGTTPPAPGWAWKGPEAPGGKGNWVSPDGKTSVRGG
jgi:uncharacterized protein RhaS with RHS repeats